MPNDLTGDRPASAPQTLPTSLTISSSETSDITLTEAQVHLRAIEQETGIKPALIYAIFTPNPEPTLDYQPTTDSDSPASITAIAHKNELNNSETNSNDQLELILVTSNGDIVRQPVPGATRGNVEKMARRFRNEISSTERSTFSEMAIQELGHTFHNWIVQPLEQELQERDFSHSS